MEWIMALLLISDVYLCEIMNRISFQFTGKKGYMQVTFLAVLSYEVYPVGDLGSGFSGKGFDPIRQKKWHVSCKL